MCGENHEAVIKIKVGGKILKGMSNNTEIERVCSKSNKLEECWERAKIHIQYRSIVM